MNLSFKEFTESSGAENKQEAKIHVIISFLAMLELVREGIIDVIQNTNFGNIEMNSQPLATNTKVRI
jgi:chromatin segregation and condensation protein Rec8/ScpA/Scc1 (kleisin family)